MEIPPESEFRAPPAAWMSAICSLFFVTAGMWVVVLLGFGALQNSGALPEAWMKLAGAVALFVVPPLLGTVSAYQSFLLARRRAYGQLVASLVPRRLPPRWMRAAWVYPPCVLAGAVSLGMIGLLTANPNAMGERNFQAIAGAIGGSLLGWLVGALYLKLIERIMSSRLQSTMRTCGACGESVLATLSACPLCGAGRVQSL